MRPMPLRLRASLLGGMFFLAACGSAQGGEDPPALKALKAQGLTDVQPFDAGHDVKAFAGVIRDQPVAVYLLGDGSAVVGMRVDADGKPLDEAKINDLAMKPMAARTVKQLSQAKWIPDGKASAPRIVYVFTDPNCPYCNAFWKAGRPWVEAGKIQMRHLLVGVIREDSPAKAAAILGAKDPSAALLKDETTFANGGIQPVASIPADIQKVLEDNQALMLQMGFQGTPGIVVQGADGKLTKIGGMPRPDAMELVFGPR